MKVLRSMSGSLDLKRTILEDETSDQTKWQRSVYSKRNPAKLRSAMPRPLRGNFLQVLGEKEVLNTSPIERRRELYDLVKKTWH